MRGPFSGVLVPVLTPFTESLAPDQALYVRFCHQLLEEGADGLAVFGTTSEANSMSAAERMALLDSLCASGIAGDRLMPGVGACSVTEAADLLAHAAQAGAAGALLLPPFYYKGAAASDDGLFEFVAEMMRRTDGAPAKVYLYHIPPVAVVGWSKDLVRRLLAAFPDRIAGLKDSSGDWESISGFIDIDAGFDVFPGSEVFLLDGLRAGGAGCITATGNINAAGIRSVFTNRDSGEADALQDRATAIRMAVQDAGPPIAVMKAYLALKTGNDTWARLRPPFRPVGRDVAEALDRALSDLDFDIGWL